MKCSHCVANKRPNRGKIPIPGYCQGCGWALTLVNGRETNKLATVSTQALTLVASTQKEVLDSLWSDKPWEKPEERKSFESIILTSALEVKRHS